MRNNFSNTKTSIKIKLTKFSIQIDGRMREIYSFRSQIRQPFSYIQADNVELIIGSDFLEPEIMMLQFKPCVIRGFNIVYFIYYY